ncbi:MAG: TetR/AcrR family transcriptional regulator, partial [Treponema sp.]|nr:TetR/AcrR family transcriptional regulator [Treponema sp.]
MGRGGKPAEIEKFLKLDDEKRDRILNAAMKEFRYGYVKASTDIIVKEAGISKGLLFHYFGTKEQLYTFLVRHTSELVQKDYFDMINLGHKDILEGC